MWNRKLPAFVLTLLLACSPMLAQRPKSATEITSSARSLPRALVAVLGGRGGDQARERTLVFLVDPTASVAEAGFARELERALEGEAGRLKETRIGIAAIGRSRAIDYASGIESAEIVKAVEKVLAEPVESVKNVYEDIRAVAAALNAAPGEREIVLVTLDNGDAEDDVELTLRSLQKRRITFHAITKEALVSDSYWAGRPQELPPRKCRLTAEDGAFVELPWGWLFQSVVANEVAPSATAVYPLNRLAAATDGRIHLHATGGGGHQCAVYGTCLFCSNDHLPESEVYQRSQILKYGPSTASRRDVYAAAAADPAFRAMLEAWEEASRAGLVRSVPSVKLRGQSLSPQKPRPGRQWNYGAGGGFPRKADAAAKLARTCDDIRGKLEKDLDSVGDAKVDPRYRAMARFTALMLQLTKVNLISFEAWCRQIAPGLTERKAPELAAPEVDAVDRSQRPGGIGHTNHCLCHGVRPFFEVELPGGPRLREELEVLDGMVRRFEESCGNSPLAVALHRSGIAHFHLTYPGVVRDRPRPRPGSAEAAGGTTKGRPARPRRSSGATGGTTTGGGQ